MGVVSIRLSDEDEAWLRKRKIKPGSFAREAVHEAIRLREFREAREFLDRYRIVPEVDSVTFFRRERESH